MTTQTIRCAVYTRKSTDEGLEKEFNTLEAQREAGENYIKSQKHQGWELLEKHYDDGGFSGGNMNRPALQELIKDIKNGQIDMIVVYKIDRLTRSLMDFSKMIDIFEKHKCSFVSVTQSFNTADSMGRLMLNVLLSFAQFEREISGERIRDKILASKKKGMWMGGRLAFGYTHENKRLIIQPELVPIVRTMFDMYLRHKSITLIVQYLKNNNIMFYNHPADYSMVRGILSNPVYSGQILHKGILYQGVHEKMISQETFNKVQESLKTHKKERNRTPLFMQDNEDEGLLKGLLYCVCCRQKMLTSATTSKRHRRGYYIGYRNKKYGKAHCDLSYIPMKAFDELILKLISPLIKSPTLLQELANQTRAVNKNFNEAEVFNAMHDVNALYHYMLGLQKRELLVKLIQKIFVEPNKIHIIWTPVALDLMTPKQKAAFSAEPLEENTQETVYAVDLIKKRGRLEIHLPTDTQELMCLKLHKLERNPDKILIKAIANGFYYRKKMEKNDCLIADLAKEECIERAYLGRLIRLTFLAPDIIDAILRGYQPTKLTAKALIRSDIPPLWPDQRKMFGFPAPVEE